MDPVSTVTEVKVELEEVVCVVCTKPHLQDFAIPSTDFTFSGISVHAFLCKFVNTEFELSLDKYICKRCFDFVNEFEQIEIEYNKLKKYFQTLITRNPLFNKSPALCQENEAVNNKAKNNECPEFIENSESDDSARLSKKRKIDNKKNKSQWDCERILDVATEKTDQLIEIVRNYAALYDPSHGSYKNIKLKNKIWDSIANVIGEKDGATVEAKWKNLRDSYSKYLRAKTAPAEQTTGNKYIEGYKAWPWVKQMRFLRPFVECKNSPVIVRQTEIENSQRIDDGSFDNMSGSFINKESTLFNQQFLPDDVPQNDKNNYYLNKTIAEYDETSLIFLGYAKVINKMTIRLQAKVKFDVAKIIMEAEIESAIEMPIPNSVFVDVNSMTIVPPSRFIASAEPSMTVPPQDHFIALAEPTITVTPQEHFIVQPKPTITVAPQDSIVPPEPTMTVVVSQDSIAPQDSIVPQDPIALPEPTMTVAPQDSIRKPEPTMPVAPQDRHITSPEPIEKPRKFAIKCESPVNLLGRNDLPSSHVEYLKRSRVVTEHKTERLIEIVKNYAILYDRSYSALRYYETKNKIWANIAKVMGEKDGDTVKAKWKNLRDSHSKYLRSIKAASEQMTRNKKNETKNIERYKSWPWVNQMKFLLPYVDSPVTSNVVLKSKRHKS